MMKDKLNQTSDLNYSNGENKNIFDDESSIPDTIEYNNLWDLENKIPVKKK